MIKLKCKQCGKSDVYESEKQAFLAGWNWLGEFCSYILCWECFSNTKRQQPDNRNNRR